MQTFSEMDAFNGLIKENTIWEGGEKGKKKKKKSVSKPMRTELFKTIVLQEWDI